MPAATSRASTAARAASSARASARQDPGAPASHPAWPAPSPPASGAPEAPGAPCAGLGAQRPRRMPSTSGRPWLATAAAATGSAPTSCTCAPPPLRLPYPNPKQAPPRPGRRPPAAPARAPAAGGATAARRCVRGHRTTALRTSGTHGRGAWGARARARAAWRQAAATQPPGGRPRREAALGHPGLPCRGAPPPGYRSATRRARRPGARSSSAPSPDRRLGAHQARRAAGARGQARLRRQQLRDAAACERERLTHRIQRRLARLRARGRPLRRASGIAPLAAGAASAAPCALVQPSA